MRAAHLTKRAAATALGSYTARGSKRRPDSAPRPLKDPPASSYAARGWCAGVTACLGLRENAHRVKRGRERRGRKNNDLVMSARDHSTECKQMSGNILTQAKAVKGALALTGPNRVT
jgi:hypothetical protein